ncbi:Ppx/GppA phosphatase family protein [Parvicella tangerina]|uniref:Exopolyphosphatase 1 n=1 Tax=Parvicella tangerina TaxID=2829795 RepID=A0A916NIA9_9FLAO|nr:exopolyphosphatase [Parvicella tangerina]CAG5084771.1 Exopolyphosphatase 1 [Parvicella tangerina]
MKLAAIDIGSNAVRLLIEEAIKTGKNDHYFKKISLTRVPIRLGEDVFTDGIITDDKAKKLVKAMKAFRFLMEANDVEAFRACATSAMREAINGKDVQKLIKKNAKLNVELISGEEEADLIFGNFDNSNFELDKTKTYLYIDVGGGSTEVTLIKRGERVDSYSFRLGSVRLLKDKVPDFVWDDACKKIKKLVKGESNVTAIGTGGNINRIHKESRHRFGEEIKVSEINKIVSEIEEYTYEDRIRKLKLKPDRADVIVPAGKIYSTFMKAGNSKRMIVPKVGLSDGIISKLYAENS